MSIVSKICLWIQISTAFGRSWQSKLHIKMQKIKNNQDDEQGGSIYSTRYTAAVIKTVWYCLKDRKIDQYSQLKCLDRNLHISDDFIYDKDNTAEH